MYLDHRGKTVPSHIALDASGLLRAGFRRASEVLADGDRLSFDITMMDSRSPSTSVFLTDGSGNRVSLADAQAREAEAYARSVAGMNSWRDGSPEQKAIKAAQQVTDAEMSPAQREQAALQRSFDDANAWRKTQPSAAWSHPHSPKN